LFGPSTPNTAVTGYQTCRIIIASCLKTQTEQVAESSLAVGQSSSVVCVEPVFVVLILLLTVLVILLALLA